MNVNLILNGFCKYIEYWTSLPDAIHENKELKAQKPAEEEVSMLVSFLTVLNKKKEK